MIFKETKTNTVLSEIRQSLDMKMAFVKRKADGSYTNIHPFVKCRDFLGDALHAVEDKKNVSIYNFRFDGTKKAMYKRKLMLAIKFPDVVSLATFTYNFPQVMATIKNQSKVNTGEFYHTNQPDVLIVEAPVFWQKSVAAISFYTFLLKCCGYKVNNPHNMLQEIQDVKVNVESWDGSVHKRITIEGEYAKKVSNKINRFITNIKKLTTNLPKVHGQDTTNISDIHNYSGFVSVISNRTGVVGARLAALGLK